MKRVKKPKQKYIQITERQREKIVDDAYRKSISVAMITVLSAVKDTLHPEDDKLIEIGETAWRYKDYTETDLLKLKTVKELLEKNTDIKFEGWRV